jgi:acylglycerol lipase
MIPRPRLRRLEPRARPSYEQKFFGSFFQKRTAFLLCFLLGLSGCSALEVLTAPPPDAPYDAPMPPSLNFTIADGTILPARVWLPPAGTPWQGIVLALHGFTDSRDAWEIPAPVFVAHGYAVYAPDQRGFGGTASRGVWPGTERLVADAQEVAGQLRASHPGVRLVVIGESMGGAVALLMAAQPRQVADEYVLSAPAVLGWEQIPLPVGGALRITDALAPRWAPDPGPVARDILASDNIPALLRFGRDPLTIRRASIGLTYGLVGLMTAAQAAVPLLRGQVLVLSGRRDQLVPPRATAAAWARLPDGVRRAFYPHGYHLLMRDTDRALVIGDVLAWLETPDAWLPSGADAAAAAWGADHAWEASEPPNVDMVGARAVWPY